MNDATFDELPPKLRLAFMLGTMARVLGRETVEKYYELLKPVIDDAFGHGDFGGSQPQPGDADDPADNYWGGVWQIHRAD